MLAMAAAMGVGRFVYTPFLPLMIDDGVLTASSAGFVAGANFLGYLVGALTASLSFFSRKGHFWMVVGLVGGTILSAAMAFDFGFVWMAVIRFLSGVASAIAMIFVTSAVFNILVAQRYPSYTAIHFAGVGLGIAISAAMVSALTVLGLNWQRIWIAAAILGLMAVIAAIPLLPSESDCVPASPARNAPGRQIDASLPPALWIYIASYGFFGLGYVILATFINAMAEAEPLFRPVEPWVWIIVGLSGVPSVWVWNRVVRHLDLVATYVLACLVEAFGVALPAFVVSPSTLVIAAFLLGGTFIAITAIGLARARLLSPVNASRSIALMTASFGLGQMIGPVVAGLHYERAGSPAGACMLASAALVLAAALAAGSPLLQRNA